MASGPLAGPGKASPLLRTVQAFVAVAILCAITGDIAITTVDPWSEFASMLRGAVTPDFGATENLLEALATTLAFAHFHDLFGRNHNVAEFIFESKTLNSFLERRLNLLLIVGIRVHDEPLHCCHQSPLSTDDELAKCH